MDSLSVGFLLRCTRSRSRRRPRALQARRWNDHEAARRRRHVAVRARARVEYRCVPRPWQGRQSVAGKPACR